MVVAGKEREDSAKVILPTTFQPEHFACRQPEKGGHPTKLLTFQNALGLVMVLPGRVTSTQFTNIIECLPCWRPQPHLGDPGQRSV